MARPGSGLISMMLTCLVTIFIAGLMVGRTPEYLGKKIEAREMKLVMISLVATGAAILIFSAATVLARFPLSSYWNPPGAPIANLANHGPHGLSEILYANASAVGTNGGAFAGLNANTPWFNVTLGLEMLLGRFLVLLPALGDRGKPGAEATGPYHPRHRVGPWLPVRSLARGYDRRSSRP